MRLERGDERVEAGPGRGEGRLRPGRLQEPRAVLALHDRGEQTEPRLRAGRCPAHTAPGVSAGEVDGRDAEPVHGPRRHDRGVASRPAVRLGELAVPTLEVLLRAAAL